MLLSDIDQSVVVSYFPLRSASGSGVRLHYTFCKCTKMGDFFLEKLTIVHCGGEWNQTALYNEFEKV